MSDELRIDFGPLLGTGLPPAWHFLVTGPEGAVVAHMTGPRLLVLESLGRWVALFEEESRPPKPQLT